MKEFICVLALTTCVSAFSQDILPEPPRHFLGPKIFFRTHTQTNVPAGYSYDYVGGGIEYTYSRDQGLNFKASLISNLSSKEVLAESEYTFSYKGIITQSPNLYPYLGLRFNSHEPSSGYYFGGLYQRSILNLGFGAEIPLAYKLYLDGKVGIVRELWALHLVSDSEKFSGARISNPLGYQLCANLKYKFSSFSIMQVEVDYIRTFRNAYDTLSTHLSFNWGF